MQWHTTPDRRQYAPPLSQLLRERVWGEQWLFIYDRETAKATLYHGDLGWEHPRPVEEGGKCPSIVLDQAEMQWLRACWLAAIGASSLFTWHKNPASLPDWPGLSGSPVVVFTHVSSRD